MNEVCRRRSAERHRGRSLTGTFPPLPGQGCRQPARAGAPRPGACGGRRTPEHALAGRAARVEDEAGRSEGRSSGAAGGEPAAGSGEAAASRRRGGEAAPARLCEYAGLTRPRTSRRPEAAVMRAVGREASSGVITHFPAPPGPASGKGAARVSQRFALGLFFGCSGLRIERFGRRRRLLLLALPRAAHRGVSASMTGSGQGGGPPRARRKPTRILPRRCRRTRPSPCDASAFDPGAGSGPAAVALPFFSQLERVPWGRLVCMEWGHANGGRATDIVARLGQRALVPAASRRSVAARCHARMRCRCWRSEKSPHPALGRQ